MLIVEQNKDNHCTCDWSLVEIDLEGQRWAIGHINSKINAMLLAYLYNQNNPQEMPQSVEPKDCDVTEGDIQCSATLSRGYDGGSLCCRYVINHTGKHKTCYIDGTEW